MNPLLPHSRPQDRLAQIEPLEARIAPANLAFATSLGGPAGESVHDMGVDASGNTYLSGSFEGTVDFDPGPGQAVRTAPAGVKLGYVAKFTSTGALSWVDTLTVGNGTASAVHIAVSTGGDIFVSSDFVGDFLTIQDATGSQLGGTSVGTRSNLFVAKIGTNGIAQWATTLGTTNPVELEDADVATDGVGGVYVAGTFRPVGVDSTVNLGVATLTGRAEDQNLMVLKLSDGGNIGNFVWANQTSANDLPRAAVSNAYLAVDRDGGVGVAGNFTNQLVFDSVPVINQEDGAFVARLDSAGDWAAASQFGSSGTGRGITGVAMDSTSRLYVAGYFSTFTDLDPGSADFSLDPGAESDGFVARLNPDLSAVFIRNYFFGISNVKSGGIAIGADDFVRVNYEGDHPRVVQYDNVGNFNTPIDFPTIAGGDSFSLAVDNFGGLYVARNFTGSVDVDLTTEKALLKSKGKADVLLAHYFSQNTAQVGQPLVAPWVQGGFALGGASDESGQQVVTDAAGNIYVAGIFNGTVDFDPGAGVTNLTSSAGSRYNIFVAKYTADGVLIWARPVAMGASNVESEPQVRLALDSAGNAYLAGEYSAQATLGTFILTNTDPAPSTASDIFVSKLDPNGTFLWAKSIGGTNTDSLFALAVRESTGQVVLSGRFSNTVDFDPGPGTQNRTPTDNPDSFMLSLSNAGDFVWVRHFADEIAAYSTVAGLAFLSGGDVVATGLVSRSVDFNTGGSPDPLVGDLFNDAYVARFSGTSGTVVWKQKFSGTRYDEGHAIAVGPGDTLFVGGLFTGSVDFDPGQGEARLVGASGFFEQYDGFLLKLASDGTFQDVVQIGGPLRDFVTQIKVDALGRVFVSGEVDANADLDPGAGIASLGVETFFLSSFNRDLDFLNARALHDDHWHVDAQGHLFVTGSFVAKEDLDPSATVFKPANKGQRDLYVLKYSADGEFDALHPRTFNDQNGDRVTLTLTGPGIGRYTLAGGALHMADLADINLTGTDLTSTLNVAVARFGAFGNGGSTAQKIFTTGPQQHLGALTVSPSIVFGDSIDDANVDLRITGKLNKLSLGDLAANAIIRLGEGLPYNVATDTTTPDTYNNRPALQIGRVLGVGVEINVIGDGMTPLGPGGGGLGNIVIGSWEFAGFIRTTQSIGDFTVLNSAPVLDGTVRVVLEIDKFHLGNGTTANCGNMTISNGAWGSSGSEIEGSVESFDADAFLAGATLTAASIGPVSVEENFEGTIILTDPDASAVPTFTVNTDYTGVVISASSIKKLKIKGDFMGSLQAPSIGSITAYSFIGVNDGFGDPTTYIKATEGALGTITSTAGPITDFEIVTPLVFKGFKVSLSKLTQDTIGIENVHITAAAIGNISVTLKADPKSTGVGLVGIANSDFTTTATGSTRATAGTIGNISVSITGAAGGDLAVGIQNSTFDALVGDFSAFDSTINSLGNISVKLSGQNGNNLGLDNVAFAGNTIGTTTISVNRFVSATSTAKGISVAEYTTSGNAGAVKVSGNATEAMVTNLKMLVGGTLGGVSLKSTDTLGGANGTLEVSQILVGQLLELGADTTSEQNAALGRAKLGAISLSGSLLDSRLVAGGSMGTVTAGKDMTNSLILAGAMLGGDSDLDGDETYQRVAKIAAVTVRGSLAATSIAAGVDPGADFIFGNGDDTLAPPVDLVEGSSSIGLVTIGIGTLNTSPGTTHSHAIEAAALSGLKIGTITTKIFPASLDLGTNGDDPTDIVARIVPA